MNNYLFYKKEFLAHFSIGAIVLNDENKVMCHHFDDILGFKDIYVTMRETPEPDESTKETLERGLMEEFGAEAEIINYVGSIVEIHDDDKFKNLEKTTLYFLCRLIGKDESKRAKNDPESGSKIVFMNIDELIEKSKKQGKRYPNSTLDESKVLITVKKYLEHA